MDRGLGDWGSGGAPQPAENTANSSQPAESTADASQLGGLPTVRLKLGCFNCGMQQEMLQHKRHIDSLKRVIGKGVGEQHLHVVTLCEVGGHRQGLPWMSAQDLVSDVLSPHYQASSCQAYMAAWQATTEPADVAGVTLTLLAGPEVFELTSPALEPQLVVMIFAIAAAGLPDHDGLLISGNLHIRTPTGQKSPTMSTRKRIAKEALQRLEQRAAIASNGASQPIAPVLVLTGDVNMDKSASDSIVQKETGVPSVDTQWQVLTSNAALSGDVLFIKGAHGQPFDVSVGHSYADRGIRKDDHDFFGVTLSIPMSDKVTPKGQKRQQASASGASEPAAKEQRQVHERATPESQRQVLGVWAMPAHFAPAQNRGSSSKDKPVVYAPKVQRVSISPDSSIGDQPSPRAPPLLLATPNSSASCGFQPAAPSASSAFQPAAPLPENPEEKRLAKNNVAYSKDEFLAFYPFPERAEREWAVATPVSRVGPRNALTGRVMSSAEKILQDMYAWYEDRADDKDLHAVFRHLQIMLFKSVTMHLPEDEWMHPDVGGASQPAAHAEAHFVVSREHVARQVQNVIAWRENWLRGRGLPLDTVLRGDLADRFLANAKDEFHSSDEQQKLQRRDADTPGKKVQKGKHSRWSRHQQKQGGSTQMWTLISFTGSFDVAFLQDAILKGERHPPMPGERTDKQKEEVRDAQMARSRLRWGKMLQSLQDKLSQGKEAKDKGKRRAVLALSPHQQQVLEEYQSGELRRKANDLTLKSGHGRLKGEDGTFVDIGGSTGGFLRTVLDDWEPPDLADFQ